MKIYCVRHGEANSPDVDPYCGLSSRGEQDVTKIANHLAKHITPITHLLHSDKLRAKQTATIFAEHLNIKQVTQTDTLLRADADVASILPEITTWQEDVMLVGHLPFLDKLVNALITNNQAAYPLVQYTPATVVCLRQYEGSQWMIKWIISPSIVSE